MLSPEQIKKVAREYSTRGAEDLGKEMGVPKQKIAQLVTQLRKLGVEVPYLKLGQGKLFQIAEELKEERL